MVHTNFEKKQLLACWFICITAPVLSYTKLTSEEDVL